MPRQLKTSTSPASNFAGLRLQIEYVPIESLAAGPYQLRLHKQHKMKRLARSLQDHGFLVPLVVSNDNVIATGSARLAAAKTIGLSEVPVVRVEHLTDEQLRLFRIADPHATPAAAAAPAQPIPHR